MADPASPAQVRAAAAIVEVRGRRELADALDALAATMPTPGHEHEWVDATTYLDEHRRLVCTGCPQTRTEEEPAP